MQRESSVVRRSQTSLLATHVVLRNTYFLLSLTLLFSAAMAYFAMSINAAPPGIILQLIGMFGLLALTSALRNSAWGILATFAFTGFMGYTIGPMINLFVHGFSNGAALVGTALGATGLIFLTLSGYVLTTRKEFSYMGGFLFVAVMIAFMVGLLNLFLQMPMLQLAISGIFALLSSALILYHTSEIIQGGERNYIMATISLYVALFNLFTSLLQILSFFAGNRE